MICLGTFLGTLLVHSSTLAIPAIAESLLLPANTLGWIPLALVIGNVIAQFPAAELGDRLGRKPVFLGGLLLCATASSVAGSAADITTLISARFLQGVGNAAIFATGLALVFDISPEAERVKLTGFSTAVAYVGITSGPLVGGLIISHFDWRAVFYIPVPLFVGAAVLGCFLLSNPAPHPQSGARGGLRALFSPAFTWASLAIVLFNFALFSIPFALTLFLQYVQALSPQQAGFIIMLQAVSTATMAALSGSVTRIFSSLSLIFTGLALGLFALLLFWLMTMTPALWLAMCALVMVGIAAGLLETPLLTLMMGSVETHLRGKASAALNTMRMLGSFSSVAVISMLISYYLRDAVLDRESHGRLLSAMGMYFLWGAVTVIAAMACLGLAVRARRNDSLPNH